MRIAVGVVLDRLPLNALRRQFAGEANGPLVGRKDADFQGGQGLPSVAVAHLGEELQRVLVCLDR